MSLQAVVKAWPEGFDENFQPIDGPQPKVIGMPPGEGIWLECEATYPPSSEGKRVTVYIPQPLMVGVMHAVRSANIQARAKPMET